MKLSTDNARKGDTGVSEAAESAEEILLEPPRLVAFLSNRAAIILPSLILLLLLLSVGAIYASWPIEVNEDFEGYLQSDGPKHETYQVLMALQDEQRASHGGRRLGYNGIPQQERSSVRWYIRTIYVTRDGSNIFDAKHLDEIHDFEHGLLALPGYQKYCYFTGSDCADPLSVINIFYASVDQSGNIQPDGKGKNLLPVMDILQSIGEHQQYFLDRYFGVSLEGAKALMESNITRSVFRFGSPLPGFAAREDRPNQQETIFRDFLKSELVPYFESFVGENIRVYYYGDILNSYLVERLVWHDAKRAGWSFLFIFVYLIFHLRSLALTCMSLFCIALSFPYSYAMYCLIYGHGNMIAINFLSLFVILGIGADDVFVLTDIWSLSRHHGQSGEVLGRRLWELYNKAGAAIFATSATTAASFYSNHWSSITPLREFGFFMGTCVCVNWVLVALLYPLALVVIDHECGDSTRKRNLGMQDVEMIEERLMPMSTEHFESRSATGPGGADGSGDESGRQALVNWTKRAPMTRPLCKIFSWLATPCALLIASSGVVLPALALRQAVGRLEPMRELPQFFPPESNLGALQELEKRFGNESEVPQSQYAVCGGRIQAKQDCANINGVQTSVQLPAKTPIIHLAPAPPPPPLSWPAPLAPPMLSPTSTPTPAKGGRRRSSTTTAAWQRSPPSSPVLPPATEPPASATLPPAAADLRSFDVTAEVSGHSKIEIALMTQAFEAVFLKQLGLKEGDVTMDVMAESTLSGRRMQNEVEVVTLHFHNLSPAKEQEVLAFIENEHDTLSKKGVTMRGWSDRRKEILSSAPSPDLSPVALVYFPTASPQSEATPTFPRTTYLPTEGQFPDVASTLVPTALPITLHQVEGSLSELTSTLAPTNLRAHQSKGPSEHSAPLSTKSHSSTLPPKVKRLPTQWPTTFPTTFSSSTLAATPSQAKTTISSWWDILSSSQTFAPSQPPTRSTTGFPTTTGFAAFEPTRAPSIDTQRETLVPTPALVQKPLKERGMVYTRTARISVLFRAAGVTFASKQSSRDKILGCASPQGQLVLVKFCELAEASSDLKIFQTQCWPRDFKEFLEGRGQAFPSDNFYEDLNEFLPQAASWTQDHVGLEKDRLGVLWLSLEFRVEFDTHSSGTETKPYMQAWEKFARHFDETQPDAGVDGALGAAATPVAEIFVRAEAELRIVSSALSSWLTSMGCALVAVIVFTRSTFMTVLATFSIFATAACCLYFITTVFEWKFGLMEAVSLIIFCGFSVDYPLHIVQAQIQEERRSEAAGLGKRGQIALHEVGWAVVSGCATTVGAAAFLLTCEMCIFNRFGQVLIANMLFALLFALFWIPAVLECREAWRRHFACLPSVDKSVSNQPKFVGDIASAHGSASSLLLGGGEEDSRVGFAPLTTPRGER